MKYIGLKYVCAKGHVVPEPFPLESRAQIRSDDFAFRKCGTHKAGGKPCEAESIGCPYGLEVVS